MAEFKDEIFLNGKINTDKDPKYLPKGDILDAVNSVFTENGNVFVRTNIKGNEFLSGLAGGGTILGFAKDPERDMIIVFLKHTINGDSIFGVKTKDNSYVKILYQENFLGFNASNYIEGKVLGDWLTWTDGSSELKHINLQHAINYWLYEDEFDFTDVVNDYNSIGIYVRFSGHIYVNIQIATVGNASEYCPSGDLSSNEYWQYVGEYYYYDSSEKIALYKKEPLGTITSNFLSDSSVVANNILRKQFRFAFKYIYKGFEKSIVSEYSEPIYVDISGSDFEETYNYHLIKYTDVFSDNINLVDAIEIYLNDGSAWTYYDTIQKRHANFSTFNATVSGGKATLDLDKVRQLYVGEIIYRDSGGNNIYYYIEKIINNDVYLKDGDGIYEINGSFTYTLTTDFWYPFYNDKDAVGIETTDFVKVNNLPRTSQTIIAVDNKLILAQNKEGYNTISLDVELGYHKLYQEYTGYAMIGTHPTFKKGYWKNLAIKYFDEFGISYGVITNDNVKVYVPTSNENNTNSVNLSERGDNYINLDYVIKHTPPIWAKYWKWCIAKNSYDFIFVNANTNTLAQVDDLFSISVYMDYDNYTYKQGDRIRFLYKDISSNMYNYDDANAKYMDFEITDYTVGEFVNSITFRENYYFDAVGDFPAATQFICEIYNNNSVYNRDSEELVYYEIGDTYEVGDFGLDTRYHKTNLKNQGTLVSDVALSDSYVPILVSDSFGYSYHSFGYIFAKIAINRANIDKIRLLKYGDSINVNTSQLSGDYEVWETILYEDTDENYCYIVIKVPAPITNHSGGYLYNNYNSFGYDGIGYISGGDTWFANSSQMQGSAAVSIHGIESKYIYGISGQTDSFILGIDQYGRINSIQGNEVEKTNIRWSDNFLDNSQINGLNFFDFTSEQVLDNTYGNIYGMSLSGFVLKVFQKAKQTSFYINRNEFYNSDGSSQVTFTNTFLNNKRESEEKYGTTFRESIVENDGATYFVDIYNKTILRSSQGGIQNIVELADNSKYFKDKFTSLLANIDNVRIISAFDTENKLLYVTFLDSVTPANNDTIIYHEPTNFWISRVTLKGTVSATYYYPTAMICMNDKLYSGWRGLTYQHNSDNVNRCYFYGEQFTSKIKFVSNIQPTIKKIFKSISVHSNKAWDVINVNIPSDSSYIRGMYSKIAKALFRLKEGIWYSSFNRNMKTRSSSATNYDLLNGEELRGYYMDIEMENNDTTKVEIFKSDIYGSMS